MTRTAIDVESLMGHVRVLSEHFPHRHTGEPEERAAVEYIADELRSSGLSVRIHQLLVMGWELTAPPELALLTPDPGLIECAPFIYSGGTPNGGIVGDLEYVGPTLVVGLPPKWEKYAVVDSDGQARAFVVGRPTGPAIAQSGPPAGSAGNQDGPHYTWPACAIGAADLARLERWRTEGRQIKVRLSIASRYKPDSTSYVVEGSLPGTRTTDQLICVGAHHDCQGARGFPFAIDSPGACDNGSGVAAVIELARLYGDIGYPISLRFCTYGGEEWNLIGSRQYVRSLSETGALQAVRLAINLDQSANGEVLKVQASPAGAGLNVEQHAREAVAHLGLADAYPVEFVVPPIPGSDHWPYWAAGIPVFYALWDPIFGYHRSGDTAAACDRPDKYAAVVALAQEMLRRVVPDVTRTAA